jgi:hypothetical protein
MNPTLESLQCKIEDASSDELRQQIAQTREEMDATLDQLGKRARRVRRSIRLLRGPLLALASLVGFVLIRLLWGRRRADS